MTTLINGIGTRICGSRNLTESEYNEHIKDMTYAYDDVLHKIGTVGFCFLFIPIFPIETIIYANIKRTKNGEVFEPCIIDKRDDYIDTNSYVVFSTYHVNWGHVRSSLSFYLFPLILLVWIIYYYMP